MEDTPEEIQKIHRDILMKKNDLDKFLMGIEMYELSKIFVKSSVLHDNPRISENDLKKEIFKRFYKNDFSTEEMEKIIESFK